MKSLNVKGAKVFSLIGLFFLALFVMILVVNLVGLIPFSFSFSSGIWFRMWAAFSFYFAFLLLIAFRGVTSFLSFFIVTGAPVIISIFIFFFEIISSLIRPFTLVVRLTVNMLAGHILLFFVSSLACSVCLISNLLIVKLLPIGFLKVAYLGRLLYWVLIAVMLVIKLAALCLVAVLILFEIFVCFIQAVVFVLLLKSYLEEV